MLLKGQTDSQTARRWYVRISSDADLELASSAGYSREMKSGARSNLGSFIHV